MRNRGRRVNASADARVTRRQLLVGTYCAAEPCPATQLHAFLLSKGQGREAGEFALFDFPGAIGTLATGINPRGDIVGIYFDTSGRRHGFLLSGGDVHDHLDGDAPRSKH